MPARLNLENDAASFYRFYRSQGFEQRSRTSEEIFFIVMKPDFHQDAFRKSCASSFQEAPKAGISRSETHRKIRKQNR